MQRAAASLGLDWMFVTAEVPEERIKEAFEGIRALSFSGAAFLPPHRFAGSKLVDSMTESAIRSGQVRIARRDGNSWLGEDTLGAAIVELLRHENCVQEEHGLVATAGQEWLSHLVRLAAPDEWKPRIVHCASQEPLQLEGTQALPGDPPAASEPPSNRPAIPSMPFESFGDVSNQIKVLIADASSIPPPPRLLNKFAWSERPTLILVEPQSPWESAISAMKIPNLRVFRQMDIAAAKAVVNFQFWTGVSTDLSSMRDALDEYCQW
jgi:Shikimate dehydrogenase substrate binding domain